MAELRKGLIDTNVVPAEDLNQYLATTHAGYLAEIQNRLWEVKQDILFGGTFSPNKRANINLAKILNSRSEREVWPTVIDPNWTGHFDPNDNSIIAPIVTINGLENAKQLKVFKGKLDDHVHGLRRPRKESVGRLGLEDMLAFHTHIKMFVDRHIIVSSNGDGWFMDSRREYRRAHVGDADVTKVYVSKKGAE